MEPVYDANPEAARKVMNYCFFLNSMNLPEQPALRRGTRIDLSDLISSGNVSLEDKFFKPFSESCKIDRYTLN